MSIRMSIALVGRSADAGLAAGSIMDVWMRVHDHRSL